MQCDVRREGERETSSQHSRGLSTLISMPCRYSLAREIEIVTYLLVDLETGEIDTIIKGSSICAESGPNVIALLDYAQTITAGDIGLGRDLSLPARGDRCRIMSAESEPMTVPLKSPSLAPVWSP